MSKVSINANHVLSNCGNLHKGEVVAIIFDQITAPVAKFFIAEAEKIGATVEAIEVACLDNHGQEPGDEAAKMMARADLALGLTEKSIAHTQARQDAAAKGTRFLSMPDYSPALLEDPSLEMDFSSQEALVDYVAELFSSGNEVHVTTAAGTDIFMDIRDRVGNSCPGFVAKPGQLGSPPDIEANISPVENHSVGRVVVDGSIPWPTIGVLESPVTLTVERGTVVAIEGAPSIVAEVEKAFASVPSEKTKVLAECGVGLNHNARLTGSMLTDEGALGTMHFGFGSNSTVGGLNEVAFHLDFVFRDPTLVVDKTMVLSNGKLVGKALQLATAPSK